MLFASAKSCFKECSGEFIPYDSPESELEIPRKFSDFLKQTSYGREGFIGLLKQMPDDFMKFGVIGPDEYPELQMFGSVAFKIKHNGDLLYIYRGVGLPEGVPPRRRSGSLFVGVNPKTQEMAVIFNGEDDLSHYVFKGRQEMLAPMLSYIVVNEAETERANMISNTEIFDNRERYIPTLPVPDERTAYVERRLRYLNALYREGEIVGALSAYSAGDEARKIPPDKQWWAANSSFTKCFATKGPSAKLDEFVGFTDKPETRDHRDTTGRIVKVEVINWVGSQGSVWTYYKDKQRCEAEQINATKSLADKYR